MGLRQAGIDVVLAADKDVDACATYSMNLARNVVWSGVDLSRTSSEALLERTGLSVDALDLVVGGPPCQGFSSAGARDWNDARNTLVKTFVESITTLRPTWFIMENVEGLLTANEGFYLIEAITRFLEAGYWVRAKKAYLERYGVPQKRKRLFIVGNLEECEFDFPPISHSTGTTLWQDLLPALSVFDAIADLPEPGKDEPTVYAIPPRNDYQLHLRRYDGMPILLHHPKQMNEITRQRIDLLKQGATMKHLPEELRHPSFRRRSYRRVMDGTPSEKRGGAPSGLKRLLADSPCLTITSASGTEFVHPLQDRVLTLRECARIQSFPDWFEFVGTWNSIATQIGNAIPPLFMKQLAMNMLAIATWRRHPYTEGRWLGIDATKASAKSPALEKLLAELDRRTAVCA